MEYPEPAVVSALTGAQAYADEAGEGGEIEWIQTHLSHVFLSRDRVYKFRKPVKLSFVDFSRLEERSADCLREVALNRRLAPDVYLGVAALEIREGQVRVGPAAESLTPGREHCVVMRRLPGGRDAASLLEQGRLTPEMVDRLAHRIAAFHAEVGLGTPAPFEPTAWRERCAGPLFESFGELEARADALDLRAGLDETRAGAERALPELEPRFEARRLAGRAVESHGDLHLQHVWFERDDGPPLAIDGLEFASRLRQIDTAAEIAFPAMDARYRGGADLAGRLLRVYASERDDFDLYGVVDFFAAYRATVRAKVAAIAAEDPAIAPAQRGAAAQSACRHLDLAKEYLRRPKPAALVLVGGIVGSGKSTAARALAERLDASGTAVVSSDRVRKHRAGVGPSERLRADAYRPEARARVYDVMLGHAETVLRAGRVAILDATWATVADRAPAVALARRCGVATWFVEARCDEAETRRRLARRAAEGRDASDAGPELLDWSRARFESAGDDEGLRPFVVRTEAAGWPSRLDELGDALAD